ncbi:uncharacterized protein LOC114531238 isoform X2 [Dendronephthya gigantea]|nr:uncharacterized protein LOC114531238 isoform X2 [Dendronephthya gigantea]
MDIFGWKINAGNSPGVVLMLIWFTLLMCALFLPNDLAENTGDGERSIIDSDNASPSSKTTAEHDNRPPSSSSMIREENLAGGLGTALLDDDSDDGISLSKSFAWHGCPPSSMVFCMYYLICLSYFVYMVISFYVPLLAKYNLGLKLIHVKLIYLNSSLFSFVLFLATPLILENVCETTFLLVSIFFQIIPISCTFLLAIFWNSPMSVEKKSYLILCSMLLLSAQLVNSPVASCLLSKLTPVKSASFYQSLTYTAVHMGICLSRLAGGSTFAKMSMMYTCIVLAFCWLFGMIWLLYEYRKFGRATDD